MFSVPSVGAVARSVLRTLIDPNPLAVSLWKRTFHPCYTWQHPTFDVTGCGVGTSCAGVLWTA